MGIFHSEEIPWSNVGKFNNKFVQKRLNFVYPITIVNYEITFQKNERKQFLKNFNLYQSDFFCF